MSGVRVMGAKAAAAADGGGAASSSGARLMTPQLELCADEVRPLLGENTDFTVVGVLGCQGVGKSTIMSLLAGAGWRGGGSDAAADTAADSMAGGGAELANPPFPPNPPEAWARGAHGTSGVDVQVTAERLILLDTQPLLSASLLLSMTGSPVPPSVHSHENLLEVQALQLCALLLSVCHVVLLVQDAAADVRWCSPSSRGESSRRSRRVARGPLQEGLWSSAAAGERVRRWFERPAVSARWRLLRAAQMVGHRLPDIATALAPAAGPPPPPPPHAQQPPPPGQGGGAGGGGAAAAAEVAAAPPPGGGAGGGGSDYRPTLVCVINRLPFARLGARCAEMRRDWPRCGVRASLARARLRTPPTRQPSLSPEECTSPDARLRARPSGRARDARGARCWTRTLAL